MKASARGEISGIEGSVILSFWGAITYYFAPKGGIALDNLISTIHPGAVNVHLDGFLGLLSGEEKPEELCEFSIVRRMSRMFCIVLEGRSSSVVLALPISKPLEYKPKGFMSIAQRNSTQKVATAPLQDEDG